MPRSTQEGVTVRLYIPVSADASTGKGACGGDGAYAPFVYILYNGYEIRSDLLLLFAGLQIQQGRRRRP